MITNRIMAAIALLSVAGFVSACSGADESWSEGEGEDEVTIVQDGVEPSAYTVPGEEGTFCFYDACGTCPGNKTKYCLSKSKSSSGCDAEKCY